MSILQVTQIWSSFKLLCFSMLHFYWVLWEAIERDDLEENDAGAGL
jgi:hypothetical protein